MPTRPPDSITADPAPPDSGEIAVGSVGLVDAQLNRQPPYGVGPARRTPEDLGKEAAERLGARFEIACPCGGPADAVHATPWIEHPWDHERGSSCEMMRMSAGCAEWDPGGYVIDLAEFWADPVGSFEHLYAKGYHATEQLLRWLLEQAQAS